MIISNLLKKSEHLKKLLLNQNNDLSEKNIFSSMNNLEQILGEIMLGDSFISSINSSNISFENGLFSNTQDTENDNISIVDILNDLIQNESVQGAIDVDTNGTLSNEEITEFLEALEGLDENPDDISINDVLSAVESISNGTFAEETNENPDTEDEIALADTVKETNQANRANRASRKSGSTRNSGANSADATGSQATTPQNMSLEELQSKKTEKEAEVKTAQDKVNAAQTGETEAIKSAQADCDEKKLAYEEAIKNDENISNELKTQQQTNQASLDSQKKVVDGVKVDINNKENEIISQNSVITQDKSKISALESSMNQNHPIMKM